MNGRPLLTSRERWIWVAGFAALAVVLLATGFESNDPDSRLYAELAAKVSAQPLSHWIAPEWWGLWPSAHQTGLFLEHPAGLFLLPAALGRAGVPPVHGAYIVGAGAGLVALLLLCRLIARLSSVEDGRAALTLLQVMPVAFIFRIRNNHEYPMLVCLLAALSGLEGIRRSWWWALAIAAGFAGALAVKGVFVALVLAAAGLWIVIDPPGEGRKRQVAGALIAVAAMAAAALAYDALYVHATGQRFWPLYWRRQLSPMSIDSPIGNVRAFASHLGFYAVRLLYHPAPWSLALIWGAWRIGPIAVQRPRERRALLYVVAFAITTVAMLSLASRFAERYAFSATFMAGAAGAVIAHPHWPRVRAVMTRLDRAVPALPAVVWFVLLALRLALGPLLPRISG